MKPSATDLLFVDKITSYTDYVHSLEKLTAYVSPRKLDLSGMKNGTADVDEGLMGADKCATVSRLNNALFHPRIHFECPEAISGRYVYRTNTRKYTNKWHFPYPKC